MAKGQLAKAEIAKKILSNFQGAFLYNDGKEIRIPTEENGEELQIKVTLTAAKESVNPGDDNAMPGEKPIAADDKPIVNNNKTAEPTQEELNNVSDLLKALGL